MRLKQKVEGNREREKGRRNVQEAERKEEKRQESADRNEKEE